MSKTTFDEVLRHLHDEARSLSEQGTLFEQLMANALPQMSEYNLEEVWLWKDWARLNDRSAQDTGIDLVGKRKDSGSLIAIQCKFYAEDHYVDKSDLDSFFTESGKEPFDERLIITTTNKWTRHAEASLKNQQIPTHRLILNDLRHLAVDWDKAAPTEVKFALERKSPREHQEEALEKVREGFKTANRGKMIMACGTGKTLTSLFIAEDDAIVSHGGHVLFLVPSIALFNDFYGLWDEVTNATIPYG